MTAGQVILWRHGQTDYNAAGRLQGQVDIPLNDAGRAQARAAAEVLQSAAPARIVSSPLSRASATAAELAARVGLDVHVDSRLMERAFGQWEGLTHPEIEEGWPEAFAQWRLSGEPENVGAETRAAAAARMVTAIRELAEPLDADQVLVLVAHGAIISLGLTLLLDQDPAGWFGLVGLDNGHWSQVMPGTRPPGWTLMGHNLGVRLEA